MTEEQEVPWLYRNAGGFWVPVPAGARWCFRLFSRPLDAPYLIALVRGFVLLSEFYDEYFPTNYVRTYPSIEAAQADLSTSPDLTCQPAGPDDHASLVETWI